MSPADWLLRGRQIFAFLLPGAVWVGSGLLIFHLPRPPLEFLTTLRPSVVEGVVFLVSSYVVGFAVQKISWRAAEELSHIGAKWLPKVFADQGMEDRAATLQSRALDVVKSRYGGITGFIAPSPDGLFGFCKRILRGASPAHTSHLEHYEEEINLLNLLPLPLLVFSAVWLFGWMRSEASGEQSIANVMIAALAFSAAILCLAQYRPLRSAERKEVFESFLTFHIEPSDRSGDGDDA